jgi:hypothetical protein
MSSDQRALRFGGRDRRGEDSAVVDFHALRSLERHRAAADDGTPEGHGAVQHGCGHDPHSVSDREEDSDHEGNDRGDAVHHRAARSTTTRGVRDGARDCEDVGSPVGFRCVASAALAAGPEYTIGLNYAFHAILSAAIHPLGTTNVAVIGDGQSSTVHRSSP